jgi:tRNA-dihydrouridine synthase B
MAGVTDPPFRTIVESFGGVGLMFSEMIPSRALIPCERKKFFRRVGITSIPNSMQIIGNDPYYMAEATKLISNSGMADIIDINFGCPVKKIVKGFAGAAVMKDTNLAMNIMKAVVNATQIPVTVKMRLGWDFNSINATTMAKIAEDAGIKMITVHGRTRSQLYGGKSSWSEVSRVKSAVTIPVIVNGDIRDIETLKQALVDSGADGAMIARGACGRPWLFKKLEEELHGREFIELDMAEIASTVLKHLELATEYYGEKVAIPLLRKHLNWYSAGFQNGSKFRDKINTMENISEIRDAIVKFFR